MEATTKKRAAFYAAITPYLDKICDNFPEFGSAGITLVFHNGEIARIELSETVQRKASPRTGGAK